MARGDYAWYGDWMHDHYQPWIDHQKRTSDAWNSYMKASDHAQNYLGGRTAGTQAEFEEAMRRYDASDAASARWNALIQQDASFNEGAKTAFDAWSNFKPEPEPTKPDFPYSGLLEPVESKDTGGGFIKNEDTGEVTNIGESNAYQGEPRSWHTMTDQERSDYVKWTEQQVAKSKGYHRIINEDGTGTIFPITDTTWSDFYQPAEEPIGDTMGEIAEQKPGQSPNDDRTKEPYDKDWPPPAPLKPKFDFDIADAGIPRTADWAGEGRQPAPESGYKWYPTNNPNDPGGGFWSPDLNHEKWKVENLGGEIGQIASSEGLQPGMIPSLEDNIARDTKQQRLAQETGTAIRQLETDLPWDTSPTLTESLYGKSPTLTESLSGKQFGQRILRGIRDELRGDLIDNKAVTGLPSFDEAGKPLVFDPNFQGKKGEKITKILPEAIRPDAKGYGAALDDIGTARMYQDISKLTRGTPFGTKEGQFILRDIPEQSRIQRMSLKNPLGSKVSRGLSGASEVQLPHGTPGRLTSADEVAELAIKGAAKKGAKKTLSRAIPLVGTALGVWDVGSRLMQGDYKGAVLGGVSMIPGPAGWAGLGGQVAYDATKPKTTKPKRNNRAMSGKSIGNVGGRKLYNIPSF